MELTLDQKTDKWLQENPEVGELCRNGERVFYVIRNQEKVEIERMEDFDSLWFAEIEDFYFQSTKKCWIRKCLPSQI